MYDFNEITVPFKSEYVIHGKESGCGFIDFKKLSTLANFRVSAGKTEFDIQSGNYEVEDLYVPWQSIPSSHAGIACKVFDACPQANVEWAYFSFKASPAKIIQGHNVYGTDNLRLCVEFMMHALLEATPDLFHALDWGHAEFSRIDATYSVQFESSEILGKVLRALRNVSNKHLRPSNRFINDNKADETDGSVYWGASTKSNPDVGRSRTLVFYGKYAEIFNQLKDLKKRAKSERTSRFDKVIAELSSHSLQNFTANRGRFEGRAKRRTIKRICGTANVWAVIRYSEKYERVNGYSFCEALFKDLFSDLFESLDGNEIEVFNDRKILEALRELYKTPLRERKPKSIDSLTAKDIKKFNDKPRFSYAKADRIYKFYCSLCDRGYKHLQGHTPKATLSRNMKELCAIGLSKADLQNLKSGERMQLSKVITIDFDNQRPADYVEPISPFANEHPNYLAEIFGVTPKLAHEFGLSVDPIDALRASLGLSESDDFDFEPFLDLNEIPISPRESLSLIIWPDGEIAFTRHKQKKFKPNSITRLINPDPSSYYQSSLN